VLVKHDELLLSFVISWLGQRMVEEEKWEKSHGVAAMEAVLCLFDQETESQANRLPCADDVSLLLLTHYSLFLNTIMMLRKKNCSNLTWYCIECYRNDAALSAMQYLIVYELLLARWTARRPE
jgi:hypothetical protein